MIPEFLIYALLAGAGVALVVEKNDAQEQRLAKTLSLPVVVADGLALDPELTSFASFLEHIAAAFETCISVEPE